MTRRRVASVARRRRDFLPSEAGELEESGQSIAAAAAVRAPSRDRNYYLGRSLAGADPNESIQGSAGIAQIVGSSQTKQLSPAGQLFVMP